MSFQMNTDFLRQMASAAGGDTSAAQGYDPQQAQELLRQAPQGQFQQYAQDALAQTSTQEYSDHVTPGVGGTNPLGSLGGGLLNSVAGSLMGNLLGGSGGTLQDLASKIGLGHSDPQQMSTQDVARAAQHAQQNDPGALATTAAQHQDKPDVLQAILGNKALTIALGGLAAAAMAGKIPGTNPKFGPAAR